MQIETIQSSLTMIFCCIIEIIDVICSCLTGQYKIFRADNDLVIWHKHSHKIELLSIHYVKDWLQIHFQAQQSTLLDIHYDTIFDEAEQPTHIQMKICEQLDCEI